MAFIFTMKSTERSTATSSLAPIMEDGTATPPAPPIPPKSPRRAFAHTAGGFLKIHRDEYPPPPYSAYIFADVKGPNGEKFIDIRNNKYVAHRGGWRRVYMITAAVVVVIVVVVAGAVAGTRPKAQQASNSPSQTPSNPSSSSSPNPNKPNGQSDPSFPSGSYYLDTFLDTVNTNCTTNPATWRCYPYTIYNSDPIAAAATFNWVINPAPKGSRSNFTISSTDNPFALSFSDIALELVNIGTDEERYVFRMQTSKTVVPNESITDDNSAAICYYRAASFQASLYTRMPKTYPPHPSSSGNSTAMKPWLYAVRVEEVSGGGDNSPECYKTKNGVQGDRIQIQPAGQADLCSCLYRNWRT